ncbi:MULTISPECIES: Vmc-like lipoprotein signal peptide domain-containing protein [unclassified Streptomyces]
MRAGEGSSLSALISPPSVVVACRNRAV